MRDARDFNVDDAVALFGYHLAVAVGVLAIVDAAEAVIVDIFIDVAGAVAGPVIRRRGVAAGVEHDDHRRFLVPNQRPKGVDRVGQRRLSAGEKMKTKAKMKMKWKMTKINEEYIYG